MDIAIQIQFLYDGLFICLLLWHSLIPLTLIDEIIL